jgi:hypothetical protein
VPQRNKSKPQPPLWVRPGQISRAEKFLLLTLPEQRSKLRLLALSSERFVTAPQRDDQPGPLFPGPRAAGEEETYRRRGPNPRFSLQAWNGKFVALNAGAGGRAQLAATAEQPSESAWFSLEYVRP